MTTHDSQWNTMTAYDSIWLLISLCDSQCLPLIQYSLWLPMAPYNSLQIPITPMSPYESIRFLMTPYVSLWLPISPYDSPYLPFPLQLLMTLYDIPLLYSLWAHTAPYGLLGLPMGSYESLWLHMISYGFLCIPMTHAVSQYIQSCLCLYLIIEDIFKFS